MKCKLTLACMLICVTICFMTVGCKENPDTQATITGSLLSHTACKNGAGANLSTGSVNSGNPDCIRYRYDGSSILTFTHVNAAFNCCPGEISAEIDITGKVITIIEKESQSGCHCLCLFDMDYKLENIPPGQYTLHIIEPYADVSQTPLEFEIILQSQIPGNFCVERTKYPW